MTHVAVPSGWNPTFRVFVNGEELPEGEGWFREGDTIRFVTPLRPQPALGFWRKLTLSLGIGVYGDLRGDALDIMYVTASGETEVSAAHPVVQAQTGPHGA